MSARAKAKPAVFRHDATSRHDATRWRRFLTKSPPLGDLIEIKRLHDNKTILRRRGELPPSFVPRNSEWRPFF